MRLWRGLARGAGLAFAFVAAAEARAVEIVSATYGGETTRYAHGVLGDAIEYEELRVILDDGRRLTARWDAPMVFEDVAPRVIDVTGDGAPEVVVVETHAKLGARLAVWHWDGAALAPLARGAFIGAPRRWLAPVGAADLDGDGRIELAYVDRPHLAKTLRVVRIEGARLVEVAQFSGVSNHRIGWDHIPGGIRDCGDTGPEMIVARGDWTRVLALRLTSDGIAARDLAAWQPGALTRALRCG